MDEVPELRFDQLSPGQLHGACRAGKGEDNGAHVDAGSGAAQHGGRADLCEAEHSEQLAESRDQPLPERLQGLDRLIARTDASSPGAEYRLGAGADEAVQRGAERQWLVGNEAVANEPVPRADKRFAQVPSALIG